jgi:hypothetical protein
MKPLEDGLCNNLRSLDICQGCFELEEELLPILGSMWVRASEDVHRAFISLKAHGAMRISFVI